MPADEAPYMDEDEYQALEQAYQRQIGEPAC